MLSMALMRLILHKYIRLHLMHLFWVSAWNKIDGAVYILFRILKMKMR